jgi:hypothetical protein
MDRIGNGSGEPRHMVAAGYEIRDALIKTLEQIKPALMQKYNLDDRDTEMAFVEAAIEVAIHQGTVRLNVTDSQRSKLAIRWLERFLEDVNWLAE